VLPRRVPVSTLQARLVRQGAYLGERIAKRVGVTA